MEQVKYSVNQTEMVPIVNAKLMCHKSAPIHCQELL